MCCVSRCFLSHKVTARHLRLAPQKASQQQSHSTPQGALVQKTVSALAKTSKGSATTAPAALSQEKTATRKERAEHVVHSVQEQMNAERGYRPVTHLISTLPNGGTVSHAPPAQKTTPRLVGTASTTTVTDRPTNSILAANNIVSQGAPSPVTVRPVQTARKSPSPKVQPTKETANTASAHARKTAHGVPVREPSAPNPQRSVETA